MTVGKRTALARTQQDTHLTEILSNIPYPTTPGDSSDQMLSCNHSDNWPSFPTGFGEHERSSCLQMAYGGVL